MTRRVKHAPEDNKFLGMKKNNLSIMSALETAVLLMEQAGCSEEDIMKYVHMIHMGWIRDGELAPEYLDLVRQVEIEKRKEAEEEARIQALRDSVNASSSIITNING